MASKSKLNLYCQKTHIPVPCYSTKRESEGFVSTVTVAERTYKSQNAHSTKKAAEDDAASIALQLIVPSHPKVTNVDQLVDSKTATKKQSSWQYLSPNTTEVSPPWQLSPGMIDRPNHNQLHSLGQSPISCMQSSAPAILLSSPTQPVNSPTQPVYSPTQPVYSPTQPVYSPTQPVYPPTHIQQHWDNGTKNKGKPSTTIPASPNHTHGVPGSITPSAPTGQSRLGSLQNSPSPAFSALSPPVNPSTTSPSRMTSNYQEALESFCQLRGLSPPKYHIVQNMKDRYTAKVTVGNSELSTEREYEDFDTAKESATALAVIQLGMETLALSNSGNPKHTALQHQAHPFRQPLQQTFQASTFTNTTPHHPQQVSLAPTSVPPLHPPSFYQTSLQSPTPSVDSSQSQPPKTGSFPQQTLPQTPNPLSPHPSFPSPLHPDTHSSQPTTTALPATPVRATVQSPATLPATPVRATVQSPALLPTAPATLQSPATLPATPVHATVQSPATLPATPLHATVQSPATLPTTPAYPSPMTLPATPAYASPATLPTTPARVLQSRGGGAQQQSNNTLAPGQYKQILNLYCQKNHINLPSYSYEYPEDSVGYIASVTVGGKTFTSPPQGSKRIAESIAAAEAVKEMGIMQEQSSVAGSDGECRQVPLVSQAGASTVSFKNLLQEYTQKLKLSLPRYTTEPTAVGFKSTVSVERPSKESLIFTGEEQSVKKAAEQDAARIACIELNLLGS